MNGKMATIRNPIGHRRATGQILAEMYFSLAEVP